MDPKEGDVEELNKAVRDPRLDHSKFLQLVQRIEILRSMGR